MKASTPSLILYFFACSITILFNLMGTYTFAIYSKTIIVPSIFIYYFVTNNYKISGTKSLIFLLSFIGEVYLLMTNLHTEITPIVCFLLVYSLILKYVIEDFRKLSFNKKEVFQILGMVILISSLFVTILNLKFEKLRFDFSFFIIYAFLLGILSILSFSNFIVKPCYTFLNLILMSVCFIISNIFYVLDNFYFPLVTFKIIGNIAQLFSYFFMVNYFIGNDKSVLKLHNN
jgi:hypothetical protein